MSRFEAIGRFVYEKGDRIESAEYLARKLNAYQMRIERFKAEVERLDTLCKQLMAQHSDISCENIKLRKFNDEAIAHIAKEERKSRERLDMAQAEIERLCKAGDAMAEALDAAGFNSARDFWNAAKEGKQP